MNYNETLDYLYTSTPVFQKIGGMAFKEGLHNVLLLDDYLKHPHRKFRSIHVGGSNGKGSTSHTLAAILQSAGYKVGLYTSPHLLDFRERIRVNGAKIEKDFVVDFVAQHRDYFETIQPSFFELTMMMGFCYFAQQEVDIAIIEVGLGGRLDSTNIITPLLSIVTNISFDHVHFLGDTLEKIAFEKAGIFKPGVPAVLGENGSDAVKQVFIDRANEVQAPLHCAEDHSLITSTMRKQSGWCYESMHYPALYGELGGLAQVKNAATLLCAIEVLKQQIDIPNQAVYQGLKEVVKLTGLMGRWQVIQNAPRIVCDTAHNTGGFEYIVEQLQQEQYTKLHIVLGMVNDKDINAVLAMLPKDAIYYFTRANIARALPAQELQTQASNHQLKGTCHDTVAEAVKAAQAQQAIDDLLYIGGSNFVIAEALELWEEFTD